MGSGFVNREKCFEGNTFLIPSAMFKGTFFKGFVDPIQSSDHFGEPNGGQPQKDSMPDLLWSHPYGQSSSGMRFDGSLRFRANGDPQLDHPPHFFIKRSRGMAFLGETIVLLFNLWKFLLQAFVGKW